mmetsp:Transcript_2271/g.3248  ORF Transcript_2271/g.3248 Transcript_2271/m.3248 type:complete len:359 (-) Transcript_2271:2-1078(-)
MEQSQNRAPTNAEVIASLTRLIAMFKKDEKSNQSPPQLSHYREIPSDVQKAYELLLQGTSLIHGTSTKYTLVGKIVVDEQKKLAADLLRGCELVGAATHVFLQDASGCSRAVRHSAVQASLSIFVNVLRLVESFEDGTAMDKNVGAQKTGAVWESCDKILNKFLPQGNRNAIRREIFTWTRECQDSMDEFQEMVDQGAAEEGAGDGAVEGENDDFFGDDDEQYSELEMPMAKACLGVLKCSRGCMKISLETCEDMGRKLAETKDEKYLEFISKVHDLARPVGQGVTELGSMMYPPILDSASDLGAQLNEQVEAITALQDYILGLEGLDKKEVELANILRTAAETRQQEFVAALSSSKS